MAEVKQRLIDGASITQNVDGFTVTEKISVKAVGGSVIARQFSALSNANVPALGAFHPVVPGARVTNRTIESLGADFAEVRVTWETPTGGEEPIVGEPAVWEIDASIEMTTAEKDKDGAPMTVEYTYPNDYKVVPRVAGTDADPQAVRAEYPKAAFALRVRQAENRTVVDVSSDAAAHVGTINSTTFLGRPARTWLCTRIQAENPIDVTPTEVVYEFIYKPDTWDIRGTFVDPFIGQIPADVVEGTGSKVFKVIGETNLNDLPI